MAFSKTLPKGQIPVGCQLCEVGNKIEWKCTDCNLLMCDRCKTKVHVKIAKDHRIVNIREIGEVEDSWDRFSFSDLKCIDHLSQSCSLYCKTCNEVICLKCIVKVHNGHTFVDEEEFEDKKKKMKDGQKKVQKKLKTLNFEKSEIMAPEESENTKMKNIKQNILDQKKRLNKAVDEYAANLVQDIDKHFKTLKQEKETKIDKAIKDMNLRNEALESIKTSRDFMQFFRDFDQLNISVNEDISQETRNASSLPNFVPGEFSVLNFGKLEGSKGFREQHSKVEVKVTNQWITDLRMIHLVVRCSDGTLWIADNLGHVLQHIKLINDKVKVLSRFRLKIYGLVDMSGNFLVSTGDSRLKMINGGTKEITNSVFDIGSLLVSRGIYVTKDNKIIIAARYHGAAYPVSGRRVVIVMNQSGNRLIEYEKDNYNKRLFTVPMVLTVTSKGNTCIIDLLDEEGRGRVVVIGQDGNVLGIYFGHNEVNTMEKPFKPADLLVTPSDNIMVTDMDNDLIHILNNSGDFISYFSVHDMGISYPHSPALSRYRHFYIGCTSAYDSPETFKTKLYELEFSGI